MTDPAATGARRVSREAFSKVTADFASAGTRCGGWLYRPDRGRAAPLVVMGPGLAAERTFGSPAYAERLAARGYAVFLFDYRGFGASAGRPRGRVSVADQLDDWRAAVARATALDGVDGSRLALWGSSLAGGHALRLARDRRVGAVVAQTPVLDGRALLRRNGPRWLARAAAAGALDRLSALAGRRHRVPVVPGEESASGRKDGDDTGFALLPHPGVGDALRRLVPPGSEWANAVPASAVFELYGYRPVADAAGTRTPALLLAGGDDRVVPAGAVAAAAERLPNATLVRLPAGHFELFAGPWPGRAVAHAAAFLEAELPSA